MLRAHQRQEPDAHGMNRMMGTQCVQEYEFRILGMFED